MTAPPSAMPSQIAGPIVWLRRSRTAASMVSGRKMRPAAMLTWYQFCHSIIVDRPKNAPAAMEPGTLSQSRAARNIV